MPNFQRVFLLACAGVIGYALAYVLCDFAAWPRLTYFPDEGGWRFTTRLPGGVPMNYVGTVLWGVGGGAVAVAAAAVATRVFDRPAPAVLLRLAGAWAVTAAGFAGAYFLWNLWPF